MSVAERWVIVGRVQGVGFRAWMAAAARRSSVRGHVRNLPDGSVEAIVWADAKETLDALAAMARVGPNAATVEAVHRFPSGLDRPPARDFEQR